MAAEGFPSGFGWDGKLSLAAVGGRTKHDLLPLEPLNKHDDILSFLTRSFACLIVLCL
jgi:hypothetical protein